MTPAELDAIEARAAEATPGPWEATCIGPPGSDFDICALTDGNPSVASSSGEDAAFIAAARQDVPELVAEVRALRKDLYRTEESSAAQYHRAEAAEAEVALLHEQLAGATAHVACAEEQMLLERADLRAAEAEAARLRDWLDVAILVEREACAQAVEYQVAGMGRPLWADAAAVVIRARGKP